MRHTHFKFCFRMYETQRNEGRLFLHEHPWDAWSRGLQDNQNSIVKSADLTRLQREVRIWVSTVLKLISQKTEIARSVNGPKLQGPRAEDAMAGPDLVLKNCGDLIRADHKVLSDNCESRNNHRYAVVLQDLATQWIQADPCK